MKQVLYYPFMYLPQQCSALGTLLLTSDQINIVAPSKAEINDKFTNELIEAKVVQRLAPLDIIDHRSFENISGQLTEFIKSRNSKKNDGYLFAVHNEKISYFIKNILKEHNCKVTIQDEYITMPEDIGLYLLGLISRQIANEKKLEIISSSNTLDLFPQNRNIMFRRAALEILPSLLDYRNFGVKKILDTRQQFRSDLNSYVAKTTSDIRVLFDYSNAQYLEDASFEEVNARIVEAKMDIEKRYQKELDELISSIQQNEINGASKVGLTVLLPSLLGVGAALTTNDRVAQGLALVNAVLTFSGVFFSEPDTEKYHPQRLIYDINRV